MPETTAIHDDPAFDPESASDLSHTVEDVCECLHIADVQNVREIIAAQILDIARNGERDPIRIRNRILQEVGQSVPGVMV